MAGFPYDIHHEGKPITLPGTGGITYNLSIGDPAVGWAADHAEPGVSIKVVGDKRFENMGLNLMACVGNEARVVSGDAKGVRGYVTGKHGGVEHVLVYFPAEDLEKMAIGDKVLVKACGQGLTVVEAPGVKVMNLDPGLLEKISPQVDSDGNLLVPVAATVPAYLMGSGIGALSTYSGDYDIMTADPNAYREYGLENLRFGDLVLLQDCDNSYGRGYLKGAVSVGVVVHSDCIIAGHGPGVTTLFTSKSGKIKGEPAKEANIAHYLGVRDLK